MKVVKKIGKKWNVIDNYVNHNNCRIWILWDETKVKVINHESSPQFIHYSIYYPNGGLKIWLTDIYALNTLDQRKKFWKDIDNIHASITGHWCLIGDYNNVLKAQDKISGSLVNENEYKDLIDMMDKTDLFEKYSISDHFTWTNNQRNDMIYSRIDMILGNLVRHQ